MKIQELVDALNAIRDDHQDFDVLVDAEVDEGAWVVGLTIVNVEAPGPSSISQGRVTLVVG